MEAKEAADLFLTETEGQSLGFLHDHKENLAREVLWWAREKNIEDAVKPLWAGWSLAVAEHLLLKKRGA